MPVRYVQPFAKSQVKQQGSIFLVMQPINSDTIPDILPATESATEFSVDKIKWEKIPSGIRVTGSLFALILDEIGPNDLDFPLNDYEVGYGRSLGRIANDYIKGRVDKGCFVKRKNISEEILPGKPLEIKYSARLIEPYAVFLK